MNADAADDNGKLDRSVKNVPRRAEAFRAQVAKIREVLEDEKAVHRERVMGKSLRLEGFNIANY